MNLFVCRGGFQTLPYRYVPPNPTFHKGCMGYKGSLPHTDYRDSLQRTGCTDSLLHTDCTGYKDSLPHMDCRDSLQRRGYKDSLLHTGYTDCKG